MFFVPSYPEKQPLIRRPFHSLNNRTIYTSASIEIATDTRFLRCRFCPVLPGKTQQSEPLSDRRSSCIPAKCRKSDPVSPRLSRAFHPYTSRRYSVEISFIRCSPFSTLPVSLRPSPPRFPSSRTVRLPLRPSLSLSRQVVASTRVARHPAAVRVNRATSFLIISLS